MRIGYLIVLLLAVSPWSAAAQEYCNDLNNGGIVFPLGLGAEGERGSCPPGFEKHAGVIMNYVQGTGHALLLGASYCVKGRNVVFPVKDENLAGCPSGFEQWRGVIAEGGNPGVLYCYR